MNKDEARQVLRAHLARYRVKSYEELQSLLDDVQVEEACGPSGAQYQMEFQAFWDSKRRGDIRLLGSIDDGGLSAFLPLCDDFIMRPDGTFVDEEGDDPAGPEAGGAE